MLCSSSGAADTSGYMPVVEVSYVQELAADFPDGVPIVHLISSPAELPPKEAAHLQAESQAMLPPGVTFEVRCCILCSQVLKHWMTREHVRTT